MVVHLGEETSGKPIRMAAIKNTYKWRTGKEGRCRRLMPLFAA
jgi:hypothetical protein